MLSVVMPTRNQVAFIQHAVESVLAQQDGLDGPLELVIADGVSTDGTPALLAEMAACHPGRIRWWSEPDAGPADAVNRAVRRAEASIVGWLNSDDLYTPGAAARAVAVLRSHPDWVMVYGEGDHVDRDGALLGRYPTRRPDTPLQAWRDGCPICQPTAYFRREAFLALGGLDTGLRTAFDYEFWLRLLRAFPGRIGFVPAVQALSRLHDEGITLRMREQVAMEGLEVVHRHLGPAPAHWLLTCFDEVLAAHPFHPAPLDIHGHLHALARRAAPWLAPGGLAELEHRLETHRGLACATERFACSVCADGWMPDPGELRLWQGARPVRLIRLHCRHASPAGGALRLEIAAPDGERMSLHVRRPGPFVMELPVTDSRDGARLVFRVSTQGAFVPAEVERGSTDRRRLAFLVEGVELL